MHVGMTNHGLRLRPRSCSILSQLLDVSHVALGLPLQLFDLCVQFLGHLQIAALHKFLIELDFFGRILHLLVDLLLCHLDPVLLLKVDKLDFFVDYSKASLIIQA